MSWVSNRWFSSFLLLVLLFSFSVVCEATDFGTLSLTGGGADVSVGRGVFTTVVSRPTGQGAGLAGEFIMLLKRRPYTLTGLRGVSAEAIAGRALGLAKTLGPLGLAFTLGPIIWDPVLGLWKKLQGSTGYPEGKWCVGLGSSYETCTADPESACAGACSKISGCTHIRAEYLTWSNYTQYNCVQCSPQNPCSGEVTYRTAIKQISCPTGQTYDPASNTCIAYQYVPATDSDLHNAITNKVNESSSNASNQTATNAANDEPGTVSDAGPIYETSGPTTLEPDVQTKVQKTETPIADQDGDLQPETQTTTVTTTTTTNYTLTYDNSVHVQRTTTTQTTTQTSITYSTTNTTTITNITNEPTVTTVDDVSDPNSVDSNPDTGSSTESEWPAFCAWASVVCSFIDWMKQEPSLPEPPLLPVEDISSSTQPFELNVGSGQCPANIQVALPQGKSYVWSYQPLCDTLTNYIHPIVLLMSAILSVYILAGVKVD